MLHDESNNCRFNKEAAHYQSTLSPSVQSYRQETLRPKWYCKTWKILVTIRFTYLYIFLNLFVSCTAQVALCLQFF